MDASRSVTYDRQNGDQAVVMGRGLLPSISWVLEDCSGMGPLWDSGIWGCLWAECQAWSLQPPSVSSQAMLLSLGCATLSAAAP